MNIRDCGETFSRYVGLELKGKITARGYTAKAVAEGIGRQPAAFNRWLNGKVEIPMTILCEACEYIDVEPVQIVEDAYSRLAVEHGERDGRLYVANEYGADDMITGTDSVIGVPDVATSVDDLDIKQPRKIYGLAADKGTLKADREPHAE